MPSITDLFVTKSSFVVRKSRFAVRSDIRFSTLFHHHMGLFANRVQTWWFFIMFPIQLLVCDIKANPGSVTDQLTNWMRYHFFLTFAISDHCFVFFWNQPWQWTSPKTGHVNIELYKSWIFQPNMVDYQSVVSNFCWLFFSYPHHIPNMHPRLINIIFPINCWLWTFVLSNSSHEKSHQFPQKNPLKSP